LARKKPKTPFGLPSSVWLNSQEWRVEYTEQVSRDEVLQGACCARSRTIWIDCLLSQEAMVSTLIHEIGHAYAAMSPIQVGLTEDQEEALIVWWEHAIVDLFRANEIKL